MLRRCLLLSFALSLVAGSLSDANAQLTSGPVVSRSAALRHGLEREWFTHVELDRSRDRVHHIFHHRDVLFVQTNRGMIHAIDAETGRTKWRAQIGEPNYPSLGSGANDKYLGVVNGSTLYVVDRESGRQVWERRLSGAPGAGPALAEERVFVPMVNGMVVSYELEDKSAPPWVYWSDGRAMVQPVASRQSVAWPTSRGYFYVARAVNPSIRFRLETQDAVSASPSYRKPYFYAASLDGYLYAVHELSGTQQWRFSAGNPVSQSPVVIEDRVFVVADRGGLYCVDAETGGEIWWAPQVEEFLSVSPSRVFGADRFGRIFILDVKTGGRLGMIRTEGINLFHINHRTDRIYLGSDRGVLQCLHEAELDDPVYYNLSNESDEAEGGAVAKTEEKPKGAEPAAEEKPAAGDDPFDNPFAGGGEPKPKEADNPFAVGGDKPKPAEKGDNPFADDDNPFK